MNKDVFWYIVGLVVGSVLIDIDKIITAIKALFLKGW